VVAALVSVLSDKDLPRLGSFQQAEQFVGAATYDFSAGVSCNALQICDTAQRSEAATQRSAAVSADQPQRSRGLYHGNKKHPKAAA